MRLSGFIAYSASQGIDSGVNSLRADPYPHWHITGNLTCRNTHITVVSILPMLYILPHNPFGDIA